MSDSFGARLRYERERRQIALRSIAEGTKIGIGLLEGLERDDVSRWPSGIFRKSFIRSYAVAIGLDPEPVVREFIELYPDPLEAEMGAPSLARPRPDAPKAVFSPKVAVAKNGHPSPDIEDSARLMLDTNDCEARPLSIKLTITWNGSLQYSIVRWADSLHHSIGRLADWKIVRMLLDGRS